MQVEKRDGVLIRKTEMLKADCKSCNETIEGTAVDVGADLHQEHHGHRIEIESWEEEEVITCDECGDPATRTEEVGVAGGGQIVELPFCDECSP